MLTVSAVGSKHTNTMFGPCLQGPDSCLWPQICERAQALIQGEGVQRAAELWRPRAGQRASQRRQNGSSSWLGGQEKNRPSRQNERNVPNV